MKRVVLFLLLLGVLMPCVETRAEEQPKQQLVVHLKSGEKVYFDMEDLPVTTFDKGQLVITYAAGTIYYALSDVSKYTYEGNFVGLENVLAPGTIQVRHNNEVVAIDGLPDNAEMSIITMDGKLLGSRRAKKGVTTMLTLSPYPAGIYIINAGGTSFKVEKR